MATPSHASLISQFKDVSRGIDLHLPDPMRLGGVDYTPPGLKAVFEDATAALEEADEAFRAWRASVARARAKVKEARAAGLQLKANLVSVHGPEAFPLLGDFGFAPPRPGGPKTVAAKAKAIAATALTREARHTTGPRQRKEIKGTVEVPFDSPKLADAGSAPAASRPDVPRARRPFG